MEYLKQFVDFILHAENHLRDFTTAHGAWVYALLFAIIFCETGLVVTPFLPGDSLLFAVGALCAQKFLDLPLTYVLLLVAAILGDSVNYAIGHWIGPKIFQREDGRFFRKEYLLRAQAFYEKYGGRAIILARFVPIVRTYAPFVAGIGGMDYRKFIFYNVAGAIAWISLFLLGGYFLGVIPVVQRNFKILVLLIIVVSILPIVIEWWRARREVRKEKP